MLLGFKKRFVEPIQIGTKVHTMRKRRKVRPKLKERLYMYTGLRTPNCTKISDKESLISTQSVRITVRLQYEHYELKVWIDRRELSLDEMIVFVRYDGFLGIWDFCEFWLQGKTRAGALMELFHWTDLRY